MVHPYEDSDSSEDEVDWQDTRHDPYRAGNVPAMVGQNNRNPIIETLVFLCAACQCHVIIIIIIINIQLMISVSEMSRSYRTKHEAPHTV